MFNNIPFIKNPDEWHCIHASMKGVLEHFCKKYYSFDYLNALINSKHNLWVWPIQVVKVLSEEGLFVRLFSNFDINSLKLSSFPKNYSSLTDSNSFNESIKYVISNNLLEHHNLSLSEIETFIHDGFVPIVILGSKKHLGKYITLTGFDNNNLYYHDSGPLNPQPHKQINKELFLKKISELPFYNSTIVVFGKKYNDSYVRFNFSNT